MPPFLSVLPNPTSAYTSLHPAALMSLSPPRPAPQHPPEAGCRGWRQVFRAEVIQPQYLERFLQGGIKVPNQGALKVLL